MGLTISRIFARFLGKSPMKILMLGLDGAGKTTILYKLRLGEVVHTIPTIGFNVETVEYKSLSLTVWDVGGQDKIRPLWRHYYRGTAALIFVVDSMDEGRLEEAAAELRELLQESELSEAALLVFANKQDLPGSLGKAALHSRLGLDQVRDRECYLQPACALRGEGLFEGLDWLSRELANRP